MRRLLLCVLALMLIITSACADGENTLLRYAVELGRELDALAEDEELLERRGVSGSSYDVVDTLGQGDRSSPREVIAVDFTELTEKTLASYADLPEVAKCILAKMMPALLMNTMTSTYGMDIYIATTAISKAKTFPAPDASGQGLWILRYEDALPVAIAWFAENGAVHMDGTILPDESFTFDGMTLPTHVIAAPRPELDEAAARLAAELQELARSDEYLRFMGLSEEVLAMVHSFAAAEDEEAFLTLCALKDDPAQVSSCLTQEIGMLGVVPLAAVSSLHHTMIFADENASGSGLYVFLYEDGTPIVVQWQGGEGAYLLYASFHPGESLAGCQSVEDISAWAQNLGLDLNFQPLGVMLLP